MMCQIDFKCLFKKISDHVINPARIFTTMMTTGDTQGESDIFKAALTLAGLLSGVSLHMHLV